MNFRKTRMMRQGVRQQIAGIVVNQRANMPRRDFDSLKATLTNCIRNGPEAENRQKHPSFRAQLQGRVAFAHSIHPKRGEKLRALLERIVWT